MQTICSILEISRIPATRSCSGFSFGKTYVNITIRPENEDSDSQLSGEDYDLATQIDELE